MAGEHPILFSGPMVRAILDGTKTQTRRIVRALPNGMRPNCYIGRNGDRWSFTAGSREGDVHGLLCPYGGPGDRLWVRETFATEVAGCPGGVSYRADHIDPKGDGPANPMAWRPSIFMPRALSRITLEIVSVRVERLQDITDDDIRAEGVTREALAHLGCTLPIAADLTLQTLWILGWNAINGKRAPWATNPWVWRIEFKRLEAPGGQ